MKASTSRRAALGAILAAPLPSVAALAAPASIPAREAEFIAWVTSSIPAMLDRARIWERAGAIYKEVERVFPDAEWNSSERENSAIWAAYLEARRPSDEFVTRLDENFKRFENHRMITPLGILLKLQCYRAIYSECEGKNFRDLDAFIAEASTCA